MIPSRLFLPLILLLFVTPAIAQVAQDVRLSPDDTPKTVSSTHRAASAVSLGDRTMVAWGRTVLNDVQQEEGVLMLGLLDGREWVGDPEILAEYGPGKRIAVQLGAIDSLFLVLWEGEMEGEARGLSARAYHPDGRPATPRLRIGDEELTGIWSVPWMPGIAIIRRKQAPPISLTYQSGQLEARIVNPLVEPGLSFRLDRDTALWAIVDGKVAYYRTMYDQEPLWTMPAPPAGNSAAINAPFLATVSDSGFSLILVSMYFSEGYSKNGSGDTMQALIVAAYFNENRMLYRTDTLWGLLDVFGTTISGFGDYYSYEGARVSVSCDMSQVVHLSLRSQHMRSGNPLGQATTIYRGAMISAEGEVSLSTENSHASSSVICTPSGVRRVMAYVQETGVESVSISFPDDDLIFAAESEQPASPRSNPRLTEGEGRLFIVWTEGNRAERLRRIDEFGVSGLPIVDLHPPLRMPDLPDNQGCYPYGDYDPREVEGPGSLVENSIVWKVCMIVGMGNDQQLVSVIYPGIRIVVIDKGRYRSYLEVVSLATEYSSGSGTGFLSKGVEPDDGSMLIVGARHSVESSTIWKFWVEGIMSSEGAFLWKANGKDLEPDNALPTGGRTWAAFSGDTIRLMDSSRMKRTILLPAQSGQGVRRLQSLPGPWLSRTLESGQGQGQEKIFSLQMVDFESGRMFERTLNVPASAVLLPYILTHPGDSSRLVLWGGSDGIYATRFSRNLNEVILPPTRISETTGLATNPSATFIGDTLTVVWEDHRHGVPAIYGLQWRVEAVEGTNSVDQGANPATLDLSWRKSDSRSVPVE